MSPADNATRAPWAARPPPPRPTAVELWRRFSSAGAPALEARAACGWRSAAALEQVSTGAMSIVGVSGFGRHESASALLLNVGSEPQTGYVLIADWTIEPARRYLCSRFDGAPVRSLRVVGDNALLLTRAVSPDPHLRVAGERVSILSVGGAGGLREQLMCSRTQTCARRELLGVPYATGVLHVTEGCALRFSPGLVIAERTITTSEGSTCQPRDAPEPPSEARRLWIAHVGRGDVDVREFDHAAHFVVLASAPWRGDHDLRRQAHSLAKRVADLTSSAWTFATTNASDRPLPGFEPGLMVATLPPFATRRDAERAMEGALRSGRRGVAIVTVGPFDRADSALE